MTTIVTRLYEDPAHAGAVADSLKAQGFPDSCIDVVEQGSSASAQDRIEAAGVPSDAARQYAQHLTTRRALLVVRAPFVPFGAAARAIEEADKYPSVNAGVSNQNYNAPERENRDLYLSVLPSHRLFLTNELDVRNDLKQRGVSQAFGLPLLSSKPKHRMRPAVIQRQFFAPRRMRHRLLTRTHIIHRFFGTFIVSHLTNWRLTRPKMSHFRITN